ncbi:MAG TPA: hypothetical protein VJU60_04765 [Thermoleophilaceae bacterium]|nr:hypothetical protein [Thermoleophilaceae bacterium]
MSSRIALTVVAALFALGAGTAQAAAPLHFTAPTALPGSLPTDNPQRQGGEPSVAFDPAGQLVYAASPGAPDHGGNFWRSTDGGRTFQPGISVGGVGPAGGGDSDIAVGFDPQASVFYIDLEDLGASDLCVSTDHGQSFPTNGCDSGQAQSQQDPAVDRPWLTTVPGKPGLVYLTYDGLAFGGGAPEMQRSTDNGTSFSQCAQVLQPGSDAFSHFSPTGATENSEVIGKPAVGPSGNLYVPFTEPHAPGQQVSEPTDPTPSNLYMGIGSPDCSSFRDVTVFQDDAGAGSDFVSIFPNVAVDPGGNVYALAVGRLHGSQAGKGDGVYLFVSTDGGNHFSSPIQVNAGPPEAAQLGALAAGNAPGEVLVGWYSSQASPDHNSAAGQWRYHVAESFDFGASFNQYTVTPDAFHFGAICNLGVECNGGRNLLDFTSVAVNPVSGCGYAVIPGDPFDTPQNGQTSPAAAYTSYQDSGPCLTPANAGTTGTVPGSKKAPHPRCVDRRKFTFHLHHARHARVVKVDVYVNGKRKIHRRGRNIKKVTLRRLPKRTFVVKIVSVQNTGSRRISVRTYRGCKKSAPRTRVHHHRRHHHKKHHR